MTLHYFIKMSVVESNKIEGIKYPFIMWTLDHLAFIFCLGVLVV